MNLTEANREQREASLTETRPYPREMNENKIHIESKEKKRTHLRPPHDTQQCAVSFALLSSETSDTQESEDERGWSLGPMDSSKKKKDGFKVVALLYLAEDFSVFLVKRGQERAVWLSNSSRGFSWCSTIQQASRFRSFRSFRVSRGQLHAHLERQRHRVQFRDQGHWRFEVIRSIEEGTLPFSLVSSPFQDV